MTVLTLVVIWAATGRYFDYSDTWQLTINTGTTIVTFVMVFLIQNSQNRDTDAIQIKLDEIIRVPAGSSARGPCLASAARGRLPAHSHVPAVRDSAGWLACKGVC